MFTGERFAQRDRLRDLQQFPQAGVPPLDVRDQCGQQGLRLADAVGHALVDLPTSFREAPQVRRWDQTRRDPPRPTFRFLQRPAVQVHVEQTNTAVTPNVPIKASGNIASRDGSVVPNVNPVVFSCSYFSLVPFQSFQFTCTVQSGRLQLFLVCTNGARVYSPVMPAINTYYPVLSCPAGTQATSIMWQAV
jgi:hypothetical protein